MGIIWGMPTLIELNGIEDNISLCKKLGLDFIELNMNLPEYQPSQLDIDKLVYLKNENDIFYTFHLPEELDITNFNEDIRDAYIKVVTKTIEISKQLKVPIINMHMNLGIYFTMPSQRIYLYNKYESFYLKGIEKFAKYIEKLLRDTNIKLAIENTGLYDIDYIKKAVNILIQKESIVLTWDVGHDYSSGDKDKEYLLSNINKIKHMHIHDAINENNHLPVFRGDIDIDNRLEIAMNTNSTCVLETKTIEGLQESINNIKAKGIAIG